MRQVVCSCGWRSVFSSMAIYYSCFFFSRNTQRSCGLLVRLGSSPPSHNSSLVLPKRLSSLVPHGFLKGSRFDLTSPLRILSPLLVAISQTDYPANLDMQFVLQVLPSTLLPSFIGLKFITNTGSSATCYGLAAALSFDLLAVCLQKKKIPQTP